MVVFCAKIGLTKYAVTRAMVVFRRVSIVGTCEIRLVVSWEGENKSPESLVCNREEGLLYLNYRPLSFCLRGYPLGRLVLCFAFPPAYCTPGHLYMPKEELLFAAEEFNGEGLTIDVALQN